MLTLALTSVALAAPPLDAVVLVRQGASTCAGAFVDAEGTVATAYHCVTAGGRPKITTRDGRDAVGTQTCGAAGDRVADGGVQGAHRAHQVGLAHVGRELARGVRAHARGRGGDGGHRVSVHRGRATPDGCAARAVPASTRDGGAPSAAGGRSCSAAPALLSRKFIHPASCSRETRRAGCARAGARPAPDDRGKP